MSPVEQGLPSTTPLTGGEQTTSDDRELTNGDLHEDTPDQPDTEDSHDDPAERIVAYQALDSFHKYRSMAHGTVHRRRQNLYALPSSQWQRLAGPPFYLLDTLSNVDDAIDANGRLADAIVNVTMSSMNFPHDPSSTEKTPWDGFAKINDHNKAQSTLRQFYRDWTAEGYRAEIEPLLNIILSDLQQYSHLSHRPADASSSPSSSDIETNLSSSQILLPGAGLSRLLLELVLRGHNATGNEISYHQLMASNFILNHNTTGPNSYTIYPWATNFCNTTSRKHQMRAYTIPDVDAASAVAEALARGDPVGQMGMAAGDFCTSFNGQDSAGEYSAVVTAYFIDTAPNLFRYIQTIHNCLQPGGLWINVGPLLWHFDARERSTRSDDDDQEEAEPGDGSQAQDDGASHSHKHTSNSTHSSRGSPNNPRKRQQRDDEEQDAGIAEPGSFELTHEEVLLLVGQSGFEILLQEILPDDHRGDFVATAATAPDTGAGPAGPGIYLQDPDSMMQMRYRCGHWVARRK